MFTRSITNRDPMWLRLVLRAPDDDTGNGAAGDIDPGDDVESEKDDGKSTGRTLTQAQIDRMIGREKTTAERAATRKLLEDLGVTDAAEARKLLESARKAADKDKTETDKLREKTTAAESAAAEARREAAAARQERQVDRALIGANVDPKRLDRMAKLVRLELDDDADEDAIKAAVGQVREDFAEAFAGDDQDKDKRRAPSGDGKGKTPRAPRGQTESGIDRGRQRARDLMGTSKTA